MGGRSLKGGRRTEILDAAARLFAERGYEGTSMADLADLVGLRKASLFHHFASKEVLYTAALERIVADVGAVVIANAVSPGTFAERLDMISDALTGALFAQPFAARVIVREALDWGPFLRGQIKESLLPVMSAAEMFLLAGQADGAFAKRDAKQLVITLIGIHFMPFAIGNVVEAFIAMQPFDAAFFEVRRDAVREQVRGLVLA